jgi:Kdo2-lipid IVA lauroyltransferase/acyltransferase
VGAKQNRLGGRFDRTVALLGVLHCDAFPVPTKLHIRDAMADLTYAFRLGAFSSHRTYRLGPDELEWVSRRRQHRVRYGDIKEIRLYRFKTRGQLAVSAGRQWRCVLLCYDGRRITFLPAHFAFLKEREDRSASYLPFMRELLARARASNPQLPINAKRGWSVRLHTIHQLVLGRLSLLLLNVIRHIAFDRAANLCGSLMRRLGPLLRGHRIARANLVSAYPEKLNAEIEQILEDMWDNLGRVFSEYAHFDRLRDFDAHVDIACGSRERIDRLRSTSKPAVIFGAHIGNWELSALAAGTLGLNASILYRRPNMEPLDRALHEIRSSQTSFLIPASFDAGKKLVRALRRGMHAGMLVDQYYRHGVAVRFFGRSTRINPLIARLARICECPIHGVRTIRLPNQRFRIEITDALESPRDAAGKIDVPATMQLIASIIEGWVRERPEQWLWMHRGWR